MSAGHMIDERAMSGRHGRQIEVLSAPFCGEHPTGKQSGCGTLDIAFDTGDLPGESKARIGFEPQLGIEKFRAVEKGIAVKTAEPRELGLLKARYCPEDTNLLGVFELRLESDDVVERAKPVVLTQLHNGIRLVIGIMRIGEPARLHRSMAQGLTTTRRHHLDGQAAIEIGGRPFPLLELGLLASEQASDESLVLFVIQRAVDIVLTAAAGPWLIIARLKPGDRHVDRV